MNIWHVFTERIGHDQAMPLLKFIFSIVQSAY